MVLGGLKRKKVVMLDSKAILASVKAVLVVLVGLGRWWVVMLDCRAILATVYRPFGRFWGVWGFDGWLSLILGPFGPQCRQFE